MKKIISIISILILSLSIIVNAQETEELPNPGILPDSPLYGLKKAAEALGNAFAFGQKAKAERAVKLAKKRMAEAKAMAEKGKHEFVEKLNEEAEQKLEKAKQHAEKSKNKEAVLQKVESARSKHIEVLKRVLEKAPEQAKANLQRVVEKAESKVAKQTAKFEEVKSNEKGTETKEVKTETAEGNESKTVTSEKTDVKESKPVPQVAEKTSTKKAKGKSKY